MLGHWLGLVILAVVLAVTFSYRVRLEERVLLENLGPPYADYMRRTKRFVPFLWCLEIRNWRPQTTDHSQRVCFRPWSVVH